MMKKQTELPMIFSNSSFSQGPELKDPRLNLEYSLFLKNKIDGEKFWVKYVSGGTESNIHLLEVRWDLFEDSMLSYL